MEALFRLSRLGRRAESGRVISLDSFSPLEAYPNATTRANVRSKPFRPLVAPEPRDPFHSFRLAFAADWREHRPQLRDTREASMPRKNGGCGPRCGGVVGPYGAGKTTLLESILSVTGAIQRKGSVPAKNTVGDASPEARNRQMSVETNAATTRYLDESFTILDCPGSIEFLQETLNVLPGVDAAIVVFEPEAGKAAMLQPYLKRLADLGIPHALFVNKIEKASGSLREVLAILQEVSPKPLVLRQIPIWENGIVTGFVDLALERAYVYREHAASELIDMTDEIKARETEARFQMLETP